MYPSNFEIYFWKLGIFIYRACKLSFRLFLSRRQGSVTFRNTERLRVYINRFKLIYHFNSNIIIQIGEHIKIAILLVPVTDYICTFDVNQAISTISDAIIITKMEVNSFTIAAYHYVLCGCFNTTQDGHLPGFSMWYIIIGRWEGLRDIFKVEDQ